MSDFKIMPKHWHQWLNPFWWRRRKTMQAVLEYQWNEQGMKEQVEQAIRNAVMYGEGKILMDWAKPSKREDGK